MFGCLSGNLSSIYTLFFYLYSHLDKLSAQSALLSFLYPELGTGAVDKLVLLYSILYH